YGYRVHGRYDPQRGLRFNPYKLLIDPYAKAIEGPIDYGAANVLPYVPDPEGTRDDADLEMDDEDDVLAIPKCVVVDARFDWEGDRPPQRPWSETVIYETHVKGFTKRRADLRGELRGTYAGLASDEALGYLKELGVTAVELLPVHHIGPMLSFRGVDNRSYYRLVPDNPRHYMDYTGTGNTLDARNPAVLRLIMDSLRHWVSECHVDGFRFDLASTLARGLYDVDRLS